MAEQEHVYRSDLGLEFKTFHNWCIDNLTPSEFFIYEKGEQTEEYLEIYQRWWADQKITKHEVYEDGVKISA